MQRSNVPDQMLAEALPVLEAVLFDEYEAYPDYIDEVFRVYGTNRWGEQTSTMAGIQAAPEKGEGESVAFDDPIQGYDKTYIPVTYAIACSFSEEITEDDRLNLVEDTYRSMGLAMYQTRQIVAFNIFNNGFSDTGPDGVALFHTAHPMIGGHTYANRPSTDIALSIAGIREMEVDMMRQVNHRNINIAMMPANLLVPPELSQTGEELIGSEHRPDNSTNAVNTIFKRKYKLIVSPFLTSTTAWYAMANKNQHQLRFYNRVMPSTRSWIDDKTGDANTRIRARFTAGYSDFPGTWGTTG